MTILVSYSVLVETVETKCRLERQKINQLLCRKVNSLAHGSERVYNREISGVCNHVSYDQSLSKASLTTKS